MGDLGELNAAYWRFRERGAHVGLAQVTGVKGSVYRRTGAKMLLTADGDMHGTVSGGCLEPELLEEARAVLLSGTPVTRPYDLAEETMWSLGIGCAGAVEVHVTPCTDALATAWGAVDRDLQSWAVVERLEGPGRVLVGADGTGSSDRDFPVAWSDQVTEEAALGAQRRLIGGEASGPMTLASGETVFVDILTPPPLLVVLGAGHDAVPVCELASRAGFRLRVVDPRPAYATPRRFSGAEILSNDLASAYIGREGFDVDGVFEPGCYGLVLHHHLARDRAALSYLSESKAKYAGILGPRSRTLRMLAEIRTEGRLGAAFGPDGESGILASPVGLDIGAEGPEEIALAIVAELVAVRTGRTGGRLAGWAGPIHAPVR